MSLNFDYLLIKNLAVPFFFISSSFFILKKLESSNYSFEILKKYIFRMLYLFIGWLIIYLPIQIFFMNYNLPTDLSLKSIVMILMGLAFVPGGWFIISCIYSVIIIFLLRKLFPYWFVILFAFIIYAYNLVYKSGYTSDMFTPIEMMNKYIDTNLSFINGFFWFALGLLFVKYESVLNLKRNTFYIILLFESLLVVILTFSNLNFGVEQFLKISILIVLFGISTRYDLPQIKGYKYLRSAGIIFYLSHFIIAWWVFPAIRSVFGIDRPLNPINYVFTIMCCTVLTILILKLERKKKFNLLSYLH